MEVSEDMVKRSVSALLALKSNVVGLNGARKVTTETIVRTVLAAALQPTEPAKPEWPGCGCRTQCETC